MFEEIREAGGVKVYRSKSGCLAIVSIDDGLLHISISRPDRYPSWEEIKSAKYHFAPNTLMAMYFPKKEDYVNLHPNCFHLYEVKYEIVPSSILFAGEDRVI